MKTVSYRFIVCEKLKLLLQNCGCKGTTFILYCQHNWIVYLLYLTFFTKDLMYGNKIFVFLNYICLFLGDLSKKCLPLQPDNTSVLY